MIYKHYKGKLYKFICYAERESDGVICVVYQSLETKRNYVRPRDEFYSKFTEY